MGHETILEFLPQVLPLRCIFQNELLAQSVVSLEEFIAVFSDYAEHFLQPAPLEQVSYVTLLLLNLADINNFLDA